MIGLSDFAIGFGTSLVLALGAIRLAPRMGLMDVPCGRRKHNHPVPLVGGLAILGALVLRTCLLGSRFPLTHLERLAVLLMAGLGLVDDLCDLRARWKAALGLALALLLATVVTGNLIQAHQDLGFLGLTFHPAVFPVFPLLLMMYWGIPQSYNLIDGANGLALGFGLVVLASLTAAGFPHSFFAGAMLACLCLNWPKARLFLGDCGSLAIGLLLVLLVKADLMPLGANHIAWVFAYPTLDVTLVVFLRLAQRRPVYLGDRNHMHFQIMDRWPGLRAWAVPGLLTLAGLCASEIYVRGALAWVPWAGIGLLGGLALLLAGQKLLDPRLAHAFDSGPLEANGMAKAGPSLPNVATAKSLLEQAQEQ